MDRSERWLKRARHTVARINDFEPEMRALADADLRALTPTFKQEIDNGAGLDRLLPRAFAAVREAARRVLETRYNEEQLLGGMALHGGRIVEIHAGEGKKVAATLPAYLNALAGKGVHIATVTDYLARRDGDLMRKVCGFMGLSVGVLQSTQPVQSSDRRAAYAADITCGTTTEFGFDYLRDNMVPELSQCVQRGLVYAIVDEADTILIDEAPTPLIITRWTVEQDQLYTRFAEAVRDLRPGEDYVADGSAHTVTMTEAGIDKVERMPGVQNIYANMELTGHLENALSAQALYHRDAEYVVRDGKVLILDKATGRVLDTRRYSGGLHQAIEAKEGVPITPEADTLASMTGRSYFLMYGKLAGMTGTALLAADEFHAMYHLDVLRVPTAWPLTRTDHPDYMFKHEDGKLGGVVEDARECQERGQPVLVGTASVAHAKSLSDRLTRLGIAHSVVPDDDPPHAAALIARAGQSGTITIVVSASLPSLGVDIALGGDPDGRMDAVLRARDIDPEFATAEDRAEARAEARRQCDEDRDRVLTAGGLFVMGTERQMARRHDLRLCDNAGVHGEPGSSRFYLSLDDELMRRFGSDRTASVMEVIGLEDDTPIESRLASRFIAQGQAKAVTYDAGLRIHYAEYDAIFAAQREAVYTDRRAVLERTDIHDHVLDMIRREARFAVGLHLTSEKSEDWDQAGLVKHLEQWGIEVPDDISPKPGLRVRRGRLTKRVLEVVLDAYARKERKVAQAVADWHARRSDGSVESGWLAMRQFERAVTLQSVDRLWSEYISAYDILTSGVELAAVAPLDPLLVPPAPLIRFKARANDAFEQLKRVIRTQTVDLLFRGTVSIRVDPGSS
jgi:preprotein translocase subunit SecA